LDLTSEELHQLCGIDRVPKLLKPEVWEEATLKFLGAERYVLGTKRVELSLRGKGGGFGLTFRNDVSIASDSLLGPSIKSGLLVDVVIDFGTQHTMPSLSLAQLTNGMYPMVLRTGKTLRIN
jgi:hypothetical protein